MSIIRKGKWLEYRVPGLDDGKPLEEVLKGSLRISGRMIQQLIRRKGIQVNGKRSSLGYRVKKGDRVQTAVFEREDYGLEPSPHPIDVLYEDEHVLVVNKPAGIAVHPTEPDQRDTLAHRIAFHFQLQGLQAKVRHVHRLDRDTTGLLLVAKHRLAHAILDGALREHRIKREYLAVVTGVLHSAEGTINLPIGRDRHHPIRRRVSPTGAEAVTHWRVEEQFASGALVRLNLETGRTHQIRVHLSHIGHPLFGDSLYGGPTAHISRQALHGARLSFEHPFTGEWIELESPLPEDMVRLIERLRAETPLRKKAARNAGKGTGENRN